MNTISLGKTIPMTVVVLTMFVLPGCDWASNGKNNTKTIASAAQKSNDLFVGDGSEVIASIGGKPFLTEKAFEQEFQALLEKNPQLKQLAAMIPDIDEKILEGCVAQRIINYHINQKGIDETPEYQQDLQELVEQAKTNLNGTYFTKLYPVQVTDAEVEKYYKENRDSIPELVVSRGGVQVKGVSFDSEAKAKEFLEKAKGKADQLESLAQAAELGDKFRDFKLVNNESIGVDKAVTTKALGIKKFPTVELVKGADKTVWVIAALSKEEPKYHPFDQVKEPLKEVVMREKQMKALENAVATLKDEYKIEIDQECLKKRRERTKPQQAQLPNMQLDAEFNEDELKTVDSPVRSA